MNVLIIGSGGREHAIAWKVAQSPKLSRLFVAPGNAGTAALGDNAAVEVDNHPAIIGFCREKRIDLVIVGPEVPLAAGLADDLLAAGIKVFGPRRAAAQIESSKVFAKQFMLRHGIPTARFASFRKYEDALRHLDAIDYPIVVKASGLAAGKGVILPDSRPDAVEALQAVIVGREFGAAGDEVVIEERLAGPEVSLMAFTDGTVVRPMLPAQDHKRLLDGDRGPNTGGMGAYAPAPVFTRKLLDEALASVLQPAVAGLRREGTPFIGVLYAGLMLTTGGMRVLEFNCRFGDPEAQAVLPLLETDLLEVVTACVEGQLNDLEIRWRDESAACVVLASEGYPVKPVVGRPVSGLDHIPANSVCFHAGTRLDDGRVVSSGGRVFGMTAWAETLPLAVQQAYRSVEQIAFEGMQYRRDIAWQGLSTDL